MSPRASATVTLPRPVLEAWLTEFREACEYDLASKSLYYAGLALETALNKAGVFEREDA